MESDDSSGENNADAEYFHTVIDEDVDKNSTKQTDSQAIVTSSLRNCAVEFRVPLVHIYSLLKLLHYKPELTYLPLSASTLLHSRREKIQFTDILPGKYFHFGVETAFTVLS